MQSQALTQPQPNEATAKPVKDPRISKTLAKAIAFLEDGTCKTQQAAAERAGMHPVTLSRALRKPEIQALIARKRAQNIQMGALRASHRLVSLIDAESEHVAAKVSERILEQSGDLRTGTSNSTSVNINIAPGYVINLGDSPKVIDHE